MESTTLIPLTDAQKSLLVNAGDINDVDEATHVEVTTRRSGYMYANLMFCDGNTSQRVGYIRNVPFDESNGHPVNAFVAAPLM